MTLTCEESMHREALLASDLAACYDCLIEFLSSEVISWCDGGETALCPCCGLDFVLGFNGAVDTALLMEANKKKFYWRWVGKPEVEEVKILRWPFIPHEQ